MLEDHWHIACSSKSIKTTPLAVTLFSKPMALFRDQRGLVRAVEDRCAHRNMPLHRGRIVAGQIECPYHGWCYDGDGQLKQAPACASQAGEHSQIRIPAYPCIEKQGYVWVCASGKPRHVSPPSFPYLEEKGWTTFRMQTRFQASVENCLENFLDLPHATFVHRFWFRSPNKKELKATVTELNDGAVAEYFEEPRNHSLVFKLLSSSAASLKHTDRFIAPSMSRVDYRFSDNKHYVISSFCSPVSEREINVFTVITFKYRGIGGLVRLVFEPLSRIIIKQDVKTLKAQQENIDRFGGEQFIYIPQDLLRPSIRRWREAIRRNSQVDKIATDKPQKKEVRLSV